MDGLILPLRVFVALLIRGVYVTFRTIKEVSMMHAYMESTGYVRTADNHIVYHRSNNLITQTEKYLVFIVELQCHIV